MSHRLDPLLRPRSIALVGASPKTGSYGQGMIEASTRVGYEGEIYFVNPNYEEIGGAPCYPDLASLPAVPEHAVLMVANARIEAALKSAIDTGVKAASIFASSQLDDGQSTALADRLRALALEAGMLICGGNGAGFYNREDKVRCQMGGEAIEAPGPVAFISQSGSIWASVAGNDGRLRFNLSVSSGQEITVSASDYMDFALDMKGTKVIGLFLETVRDPEKFIAVLERAAQADIPVVINKVAKSEQAKKFAVSHSGALAGDDSVYDAVFQRYGVVRVDNPDELVAALQLLSTGRRASAGGIVAITDSGGERELLTDVAFEHGVPFASINEATKSKLSAQLEYGLEPENPLDAWGSGHGFGEIFKQCFSALLEDPDAAMGIWVADLRDTTSFHKPYVDAAMRIVAATDKPVAFATCYSKGMNRDFAVQLEKAGVPVLEGIRPAMMAARAALDYRAFQNRPPLDPPPPPAQPVVARWLERCATGTPFDEADGLSMLSDFGVPTVAIRLVESADDAVAAATALGFPVALKTAAPEIQHKSDVGGVRLGLADAAAVAAAYDDLAARLGARVLVSKMVSGGVEVTFGFVSDPQFGPIVMIGAGGTLVEVLRDTRFAVPPLDERMARDLIDELAMRPLLDGVRGSPALDVDALARAFARFSVLIATLSGSLKEMDVNPVIVGSDGVMAVDVLVVPAKRPQ